MSLYVSVAPFQASSFFMVGTEPRRMVPQAAASKDRAAEPSQTFVQAGYNVPGWPGWSHSVFRIRTVVPKMIEGAIKKAASARRGNEPQGPRMTCTLVCRRTPQAISTGWGALPVLQRPCQSGIIGPQSTQVLSGDLPPGCRPNVARRPPTCPRPRRARPLPSRPLGPGPLAGRQRLLSRCMQICTAALPPKPPCEFLRIPALVAVDPSVTPVWN